MAMRQHDAIRPKTGWTGDVPAKKNGQTNKIHLSIRFGGALSTALEPKTSSRVTVLASSVKLKLSTTRSSKT